MRYVDGPGGGSLCAPPGVCTPPGAGLDVGSQLPSRLWSAASGRDRTHRFAFLSTCPEPWGGSEELWWAAACRLRDARHEVDILKTIVDFGHPRTTALLERGCTVRDLASVRSRKAWEGASLLVPFGWAPTEAHRQLLVATRRLVARRPDLAVVSQGQNFDGLHLARLCGRLRIPYVLISQKASELVWPPDGIVAYGRRVFANARRCVFVSEHNRRLTELQFATTFANATQLYNPVLLDPGALPWPPQDELRLACVARLHTMEKGQDLLLRVLAQPEWRQRSLRVSLFGQGVHADGLRHLAATLGVDRVAFRGSTADIAAVWRDHHALVLPSRAEGMPLALLEAMACGRPAVVTDVGGNAELVQDGVHGFVAGSASVEALSAALERAWRSRDSWREMGQAAATRVASLAPHRSSARLSELLLAEVPARAAR